MLALSRRARCAYLVLLAIASLAATAKPVFADADCHAVAVAGGPYRAPCQGQQTTLRLDGTHSPRCPGAKIEYRWSSDCPGAKFDDPTSLTPLLTLTSPPACPVSCRVTLTAIDVELGGSDRDHAPVEVFDDVAPTGVAPDAVLAELWPPDHRLVCFAADALAGFFREDCSGLASWRVLECSSNEEDDAKGSGDGHTGSDCQVAADGLTVCARAERAGAGSGRRYRLIGEAVDVCGNSSSALDLGVLYVPHDRR